MTNAIRQALTLLPLALILSGCASGPRIESSSSPTPRSAVLVVDRSDSESNETLGAHHSELLKADTQHDITLEQIREHMQNGTAVLIDARGPATFARGHVRGALNLPAGETDAYMPKIWPNVSSDQFIIIYCASPTCGAGDTVHEFLAGQGFTNMRVYSPGWMKLAAAKDLR